MRNKTAKVIAEALKDATLLTTAQTTRCIVFDGDDCICMTEDMLDAWWANLKPEHKATIYEADLEGEIRDEAPDAIGFTPAAPLQPILVDGLRELGLVSVVDRINGVQSTWNTTLAAPLCGLGERRVLLGGQLQPQPATALLQGVVEHCDGSEIKLCGSACDQLPDAVRTGELAQVADSPVQRGRRELDNPFAAATHEETQVDPYVRVPRLAADSTLALVAGPGLRQQSLAPAADRTLLTPPNCGSALPTHAAECKRTEGENAVEGFRSQEVTCAHA